MGRIKAETFGGRVPGLAHQLAQAVRGVLGFRGHWGFRVRMQKLRALGLGRLGLTAFWGA